MLRVRYTKSSVCNNWMASEDSSMFSFCILLVRFVWANRNLWCNCGYSIQSLRQNSMRIGNCVELQVVDTCHLLDSRSRPFALARSLAVCNHCTKKAEVPICSQREWCSPLSDRWRAQSDTLISLLFAAGVLKPNCGELMCIHQTHAWTTTGTRNSVTRWAKFISGWRLW